MKDRLLRLIAIDVRSLAALRICLGILLLVDLAIRSQDLTAHYTDAGVAPRHLLSPTFIAPFYFLSGSAEVQAAFFGLEAAAALALLLGYFTRVATCLSWVLLASLHDRNLLIINAGDELLRMLLLWSMFLPLGRVWSIDAWRKSPKQPAAGSVVSIASAAILLQMCLVYWFSAFFKYNDVWKDGLGLYYSLNYDAYAKPLAATLLEHPQLLHALSLATLWGEALLPVLLFVPWGARWLRLVVVAAFFALHIGIELTLTVGLFSYISMCGWLVFLPPEFWNFLTRRKTAGGQARAVDMELTGPSIVPQGVCAVLLVYVVLWNFSTTGKEAAWYTMPDALKSFGRQAMIYQKWNMFGKPATYDGWFVVSAWLNNQTDVDLLAGGKPTTIEKPEHLYRRHPNHRWRKFFRNLGRRRGGRFRFERFGPPVCRYLSRQWNATHGEQEQIVDIDMYLMTEVTPPPGEETAVTQVLWHKEILQADSSVPKALQQWDADFGDLPPGI